MEKSTLRLHLINKNPREIILCSALLFASLAIFAPLARAQRYGYNPANPTLDSLYSSGQYPCTYYNQNAGNCDLAEFRDDNSGGGTPDCYGAGSNACSPNGGAVACAKEGSPNCVKESSATPGNKSGEVIKNQPLELRVSKPADFNRDIYYRNKLEFSLEGGWHPINIPFPLDGLEGDPYHTYPLKYTLVPIIASLRWQMGSLGGPWILRGNWDLTFSGCVTAIPRGPETRYFAYIMGVRRNFVPRNSRVTAYFDIPVGLGNIDAKGGPHGIKYAQGQNFTFTINAGSGVRYNLNPRYAISAGLNYMHISNANLSGQRTNYGINVYGPMFGIDIQLRRHQRHSVQ